MATKRSVVLRGCPIVNEDGVASAHVKPGYLVKGVSSIAHQSATTERAQGVRARARRTRRGHRQHVPGQRHHQRVLRVGRHGQGRRVQVAGDEATVYVASGQNITEDDLLSSAGDGTFKEEHRGTGHRACDGNRRCGHGGDEVRVQFI
jgi:hypothetical protein